MIRAPRLNPRHNPGATMLNMAFFGGPFFNALGGGSRGSPIWVQLGRGNMFTVSDEKTNTGTGLYIHVVPSEDMVEILRGPNSDRENMTVLGRVWMVPNRSPVAARHAALTVRAIAEEIFLGGTFAQAADWIKSGVISLTPTRSQ